VGATPSETSKGKTPIFALGQHLQISKYGLRVLGVSCSLLTCAAFRLICCSRILNRGSLITYSLAVCRSIKLQIRSTDCITRVPGSCRSREVLSFGAMDSWEADLDEACPRYLHHAHMQEADTCRKRICGESWSWLKATTSMMRSHKHPRGRRLKQPVPHDEGAAAQRSRRPIRPSSDSAPTVLPQILLLRTFLGRIHARN
jgi:hypothetical protein